MNYPNIIKFYKVFLFAGLINFLSCASTHQTISIEPAREKKAVNPIALNRFVDGVIYDLKENYAAALLAYQEAMLYDSTSSEICLAIGREYLRMGKAESAEHFFKRTLKLDKKNAEAREFIANIYLDQGKWDLAEGIYAEILKKDPQNVDALYNLAQVYLQKGDGKKSAEMLEKVILYEPNANPQVYISLGELYLKLGKLDGAEKIFTEVIKKDEAESSAFYGVGLAKEAKKDTAGAVSFYKRALEINPQMVFARERLSNLYSALGEWDKAIEIYKQEIANDSTNVTAMLGLSEVYRKKSDFDNALRNLEVITRKFPDDFRAFLDAGRIHLDDSEFFEAYKNFKHVLDIDSENFMGWLFGGISLFHQDSLSQAEYFLGQALKRDPKSPLGNYYLGSLYSQKGRNKEAIPYLKQAVDARPKWVAALSTLASAYDATGDYIKSDSIFEKILSVEPENAITLNNYAYSLSKRAKDLDRALNMVTKALKAEPENGAFLDTAGWINFQMGRYETAKEFLEKAWSVRKESAEVAEHLGDIYSKLGMKNKAEEAWKEAFKLNPKNESIKAKLGLNGGDK